MADRNEIEARIRRIRRKPSEADADDVECLLSALESEEVSHRRSAALALAGVSTERPRALAEHVEELGDALGDDPLVRGQIVQSIADVATAAPERVVPLAADLRVCLGIDSDVTERSALRALTAVAEVDSAVLTDLVPALCSVVERGSNLEESVVRALVLLAETLPEASDEVASVAPDLLAVLESVSVDSPTPGSVDDELETFVEPDQRDVLIQRTSARKMAGVVLARLAAERPAVVNEHVEEVGAFLDDSDPLVRKAVVDTFHSVVTADSTSLTSGGLVPTLADRLRNDDEDEDVRGRIAAILGTATIESPEATLSVVETVVPATTELLEAEEAEVRADAAKLLASIAAVKPAAVSQATPELRSRLTDDDPIVRARALWALRDLRATDATPQIREMADGDDDPDVRALARETLDEFSDSAE